MEIRKKKSNNSGMFATLSIFAIGAYYTTDPSLIGLGDGPTDPRLSHNEKFTKKKKPKSLIENIGSTFIGSNQNITFDRWTRTPEAVEAYEKWRKSPTGINALIKDFKASSQFGRYLEKWAAKTKRSPGEFRKVALKSDKYKSLFHSWKATGAGALFLKDQFITSPGFDGKKDSWINSPDAVNDLANYLNSDESKKDYLTWYKDATNKAGVETNWKKTANYTTKRDAWLALKNAKDDKAVWINSDKSQTHYNAWKASPNYRDDLISSWKKTANYRSARDQWIIINSIKRPIEEYKKEESFWLNQYQNYKNSPAGNLEIENAIKQKSEYLAAKNTWSPTGKNAWLSSDVSTPSYNTWRVTANARNNLKPNFEASTGFDTLKEDWIDNNYNPKSKANWINDGDATPSYNLWKATNPGQRALQTTWKTTQDYINSKNAWVALQPGTRDKADWSSSQEGLGSYNTWKAIAANETTLKTHWQSQADFATAKSNWLTKTYNSLTTSAWADSRDSTPYYNTWRVTSGARNLLKGNWEASNDFTSAKSNWATTDFDNTNHTKVIWSQDADFTNKYNTWKAISGNEDDMKTSWKMTKDYTNARDSWINTWSNTNDKTHWSSLAASATSYNTWKDVDANETSLKNHWQTQADFTTAKSNWLTKTFATLTKNAWADSNDSNPYYNTWRVTDRARNLLKTNWEATGDFTSAKSSWAATDFKYDAHSKDIWSQDPDFASKYNTWKVIPANVDMIKTAWKATPKYISDRDAWINTWANTNDKSHWSSTQEGLTSYNKWKAISANDTNLKNHWQGQQDFVSSKNRWVNSDYTTISKTQWLNQGHQDKLYTSWWKTDVARNLVRSNWEGTSEYKNHQQVWATRKGIHNNFPKSNWESDADFTSKYNDWKTEANSPFLLKEHFKKQNLYQTKYQEWITNQNFAKSVWQDTRDSLENYRLWKTGIGAYNALIAKWKGVSDYTNKKAEWASANGVASWEVSDDAKETYNGAAADNNDHGYKVTDEFRNIFEAKWKATNDYSTKKTAWKNKYKLDHFFNQPDAQTSYNTYKTSVAGDLEIKDYWRKSKDYKDKRDAFLSGKTLSPTKATWIASNDSIPYSSRWKNSISGQKELLKNWKTTNDYQTKKQTWLNNYVPPQTKDQWVNNFQTTKIETRDQYYNKSEWELKYDYYVDSFNPNLKSYYQTLPHYSQKKAHWISNKYVKPLKSEWEKTQTATTAFETWKATTQGQNALRAAYEEDVDFNTNVLAFQKSLEFRRSFYEWSDLDEAQGHYDEWKTSNDGRTSLENKWESTADFTTKKQDWVNLGTTKRGIEQWGQELESSPYYDAWRQTTDGQNALKDEWEKTNNFINETDIYFDNSVSNLNTQEEWLNSIQVNTNDFEDWFAKQNVEQLKEEWINTTAFKELAETDTVRTDFINDEENIARMVEHAIKIYGDNRDGTRDRRNMQNFSTRFELYGNNINNFSWGNVEDLAYYPFVYSEDAKWDILMKYYVKGTAKDDFLEAIKNKTHPALSEDAYKGVTVKNWISLVGHRATRPYIKKFWKQLIANMKNGWRKDTKAWITNIHEKFLEDERIWKKKKAGNLSPLNDFYNKHLLTKLQARTTKPEFAIFLKSWAKTKWANKSYRDFKSKIFRANATKYNEALDKWSSNKAHGIDHYIKSSDAKNNYNNWNDPNKITTTADNYKSNYQYRIDLELYNNTIGADGKTNSFNHYLTQSKAREKYNSWIDPDYVQDYKNDAQFQTDYATYRDSAKSKLAYFAHNQAITDYERWDDTTLSTEMYENSLSNLYEMIDYFKFNNTGINQGKAYYLSQSEATNDYNDWVDYLKKTTYKEGYPQFDTDHQLWLQTRSNWISFYDGVDRSQQDHKDFVYQGFTTEFETQFALFRDGKHNSGGDASVPNQRGFVFYKTTDTAEVDSNNWWSTQTALLTGLDAKYSWDGTENTEYRKNYNDYRDSIPSGETNTIGFIEYLKTSKATQHYQTWIQDPNNPIYSKTNHYSDSFNKYIDGIETGESISRGHKWYLEHSGSNRPFDAWILANKEKEYLSSQTFNTDFTNFIDTTKSGQTKTNSQLFYLGITQSDLDYLAWKDEKINVEFRKDKTNYDHLMSSWLGRWLPVANNGLNIYKNHNQSTIDYNAWLDDDRDKKYKQSPNLQTDFETYRDKVETGQTLSIGHLFYLNDGDSDADYNSWKDTVGETSYLSQQASKTAFETYRDKKETGQLLTNGQKVYFAHGDSDTDYNNWKDQRIDEEFKADITNYNVALDNWTSTKANGVSIYKTKAQSGIDFNDWKTSQADASYIRSADAQTDFETYRDRTESGQTLPNGHLFYLTQGDSNTDYNSWKDTTGESSYLADQDFQTDFETYRDTTESGESLTNGAKAYFADGDSDTDYNTWKDQKIDTAFKADTTNYNAGLDNWTSTKANGIGVYKTQAKATTDFNTWKTSQADASYITSADAQTDFETYRDTVESGQSLSIGHLFYLNQGDSDTDFANQKILKGDNDYPSSAQFTTDFNGWESFANGKDTYSGVAKSDSDYQQWIYQVGEAPYKNSGQYITDLDAWSTTKANGLDFFKASRQSQSDWLNILDSEFAKTQSHTDKIAELKPIYDKQIYQDSNQFITDYNAWDDPKKRSEDKYLLDEDNAFSLDLNNYYDTPEKKVVAYAESAQSDIDYGLYAGEVKSEDDYLKSPEKTADVDEWATFDNAKPLFQDSPFVKTKTTRSKDTYIVSNQFITDAKAFLATTDLQYYDLYLTGDILQSLHEGWKDPVGVERDPEAYIATTDFVEKINSWSSNIINGMTPFEQSTLAQTLFQRYINK